MIIAVDGPAGAGKSTVAKLLAKQLDFLYIDTGAMYRALTLKVIDNNVDTKDAQALTKTARNSKIDLVYSRDEGLKVFLDGQDVSKQIRQPRITAVVSDIAKVKQVREIMVELQRKLGKDKDVVLDGRDIGTVVFPGADRKFYIDAQFKERARRRYKELIEAKQNVTIENIEADLGNRDAIDSTREVAPLKKAADAIYIDTTGMSIDEVVRTMLKYVKE